MFFNSKKDLMFDILLFMKEECKKYDGPAKGIRFNFQPSYIIPYFGKNNDEVISDGEDLVNLRSYLNHKTSDDDIIEALKECKQNSYIINSNFKSTANKEFEELSLDDSAMRIISQYTAEKEYNKLINQIKRSLGNIVTLAITVTITAAITVYVTNVINSKSDCEPKIIEKVVIK